MVVFLIKKEWMYCVNVFIVIYVLCKVCKVRCLLYKYIYNICFGNENCWNEYDVNVS